MSEKSKRPPFIPRFLLGLMQSGNEYEEFADDVNEIYQENLIKQGRWKAGWWYWLRVLESIPVVLLDDGYWRFAMVRNYLKILMRNIRRNRAFTFITMSGLVVGMTVSILLIQFIRYELSYDGFHEHADDIYRITDRGHSMAQPELAGALLRDVPEVLHAGRVVYFRGFLKIEDEFIEEDIVHFADPDIMHVFTFPSITGDASKILAEPFSVLITESLADKYFKNQDPLGKTITFYNRFDFTIRGILKDVPENSHFTFNMLVSLSSLKALIGENFLKGWGSREFFTYVRLVEGTDPERFAGKLEELKKTYELERPVYTVQSLKRIHVSGNLQAEMSVNSDMKYISLLIVATVFILSIICLNYINLSTARASKRMKEIGLRKVVGSSRYQLVGQFMDESILLVVVSMLASLAIVFTMLPSINVFLGRSLTTGMFLEWGFLQFLVGLTILLGFASGMVPALYLSSFKPVSIVQRFAQKRQKSGFRNALVVVQFVVTIALVIGSMIVYRQLQFIRERTSSVYGESVVVLSLTDPALRSNHDPLMTELIRHPGIREASASFNLPFDISIGSWMTWEGQLEEEKFVIRNSCIDEGFVDFYGLEIVSGRNISGLVTTDATKAVLLNETAARKIGREDILGMRVSCSLIEDGVVVGIMKDFNFKSLYQKIEPLLFVPIREGGRMSGVNFISLKVDSRLMQEVLIYIDETWKDFSEAFPLEYSFLDERVDGMYRQEIAFGESIRILTIIEIALACLGLFGLSLFTAEQRVKEIGIRKVMGASAGHIVLMLGRELMKWIIVASVVAFPIAYLVMNKWLQNYEYRTGVEASIFLLASGLVFLVAAITVSFQSMKAAGANPVDSLKYE